MLEKEDVWWGIHKKTDIALLGTEISKVLLSCAIPFLECFGTLRIFDDHLLSRYDANSMGIYSGPLALARATLAAQLGDKKRATSLLRAEFEDCRFNPFADTVRRVAQELGVNLEPAAES